MCLRTWFNQSHTCPVCRAVVTSHEAVSGSAADYERAQRRQERRRERLQRAQMQHDARLARQYMIQDLLEAREMSALVAIREVTGLVAHDTEEHVFVVEYDIDQINW